MLFTSCMVGLIAIASAAPTLDRRVPNTLVDRAITPYERGLTWTPRRNMLSAKSVNSYNAFGTSFSRTSLLTTEEIIILTLQEQVLAREALQLEIELSRAIKAELKLKEEFQFALDNIRRNTFKNQNSNMNTVIVVITEVIDNRDSTNPNTRYLSRQIQSNTEVSEQVFVVIQESAQITIGSNANAQSGSGSCNPSKTGAAQATGTKTGTAALRATGTSTPTTGTFTQGQALAAQPGLNIYPSGMAVPQFSNGKSSRDPAIIILENQAVFVEVVGSSNTFVVTETTVVQSS